MAKHREAKKKSKPRKSKARRAAAKAAPRKGGRFASKSTRQHGGRHAGRALPKLMTPDDRREYNMSYKQKIDAGYDANDARKMALEEWQMDRVRSMAHAEDASFNKAKSEKESKELGYLDSLLKKLKRR
jgi:hypothetical protein